VVAGSVITRPATTLPSAATTGSRRIAPAVSAAACGAVIIGVIRWAASAVKSDSVNVVPACSGGVSSPLRARAARCSSSSVSSDIDLASASSTAGTIRAASVVTTTPTLTRS